MIRGTKTTTFLRINPLLMFSLIDDFEKLLCQKKFIFLIIKLSPHDILRRCTSLKNKLLIINLSNTKL